MTYEQLLIDIEDLIEAGKSDCLSAEDIVKNISLSMLLHGKIKFTPTDKQAIGYISPETLKSIKEGDDGYITGFPAFLTVIPVYID